MARYVFMSHIIYLFLLYFQIKVLSRKMSTNNCSEVDRAEFIYEGKAVTSVPHVLGCVGRPRYNYLIGDLNIALAREFIFTHAVNWVNFSACQVAICSHNVNGFCNISCSFTILTSTL